MMVVTDVNFMFIGFAIFWLFIFFCVLGPCLDFLHYFDDEYQGEDHRDQGTIHRLEEQRWRRVPMRGLLDRRRSRSMNDLSQARNLEWEVTRAKRGGVGRRDAVW